MGVRGEVVAFCTVLSIVGCNDVDLGGAPHRRDPPIPDVEFNPNLPAEPPPEEEPPPSGDGSLLWAVNDGGVENDQGRVLATLSDDSFVSIGWLAATAAFGPTGSEVTIAGDGPNPDLFLARYDEDASLVWLRQVAGGYKSPAGATTLSDDSFVVVGEFGDPVTFAPGAANETTLVQTGYQPPDPNVPPMPPTFDLFLARYDAGGGLVWALRAGSTSYDRATAVTALSDDSFVVVGAVSEQAVFGQGSPAETTLPWAGQYDVAVARYHADGSLAWARWAGGTSSEWAMAAAALSDDSVVVAGHFEGEVVFGMGEPNQTVLESAGGKDVFVARYAPDGSLMWAAAEGGFETGYAFDLAALPDDSFVLTGMFTGPMTFGVGETTLEAPGSDTDMYLARYDAGGGLVWARRGGGYGAEAGARVAALSDGSAVVCGRFETTADFPDADGTAALVSAGNRDQFLARYLPSGELFWLRRAGGAEAEMCGDLASLSDDSTVVTGYFEGSSTFGPDEPNETTLVTYGVRDAFHARYAP